MFNNVSLFNFFSYFLLSEMVFTPLKNAPGIKPTNKKWRIKLKKISTLAT